MDAGGDACDERRAESGCNDNSCQVKESRKVTAAADAGCVGADVRFDARVCVAAADDGNSPSLSTSRLPFFCLVVPSPSPASLTMASYSSSPS